MDVRAAVIRNLLRAVDGLPGLYAVGLVTMFCDRQSNRLGDLIAGTVVVHERAEKGLDEWTRLAQPQPLSISAGPEVARLTPEEVLVIETFLARRYELDPSVALEVAGQIADRMAERTGLRPAPNQSVADFLEAMTRAARSAGAGQG